MKKVYLAHSLATTAEFNDSIRVANALREVGYSVYVASENLRINDKSNNPEPIDIYEGDVSRILESDIFVVNLSDTAGTISEIGCVAGLNERASDSSLVIPIIAYTSNARLMQPQFYKGIPSASANHLVLGMVDKWGEFVGSEDVMVDTLIAELERMKLGGDV